MLSSRRPRESGFSLIEVLVALAITASVFLVASRLYGSSLGATARSEQMTQAALAAESKLAELGVVEPLRVGRTEGRSGDYRWSAEIRDYTGISAEMQERLPVRAYEVAVTVAWGAGETAAVTIRSVKIGPRPRRE